MIIPLSPAPAPPIPQPVSGLSDRSLTSELIRIQGVPLETECTEEDLRQVEQFMERPEARGHPDWNGLFRKQAESVLAYLKYEAFAALVGVGQGKTGITIMVASLASERFGQRRTMLFVPNRIVPELLSFHIPMWRKFCRIQTAFHSIYGRSRRDRLRMAQIKAPGCYIVPYSLLSTQDSSELIDLIEPETLILDEAHSLSISQSARTDRIFGRDGYYTKKRHADGQRTRVVILTGTPTNSGLNEYYHLLAASVGTDKVPMPNDYDLRKSWDRVISSERKNGPLVDQDPQDIRAVYPMLNWARATFPDLLPELGDDLSGLRRAYKLRLVTTPGIVCSSDDDIGVDLSFAATAPTAEMPETLAKMIQGVEDMVTPDGRMLAHPMHKWLYLWLLSSGFYYKPTWPKSASHEQIAAAQRYIDAHSAYNRVLRQYLSTYRRKGHDTPFLVGQAMHQHGVNGVRDPALYQWWHYKQECRKLVTIKIGREEVWVDDCKLHQVARDVESLPDPEAGALVWYYHIELGKRLAEHLRQRFGADRVVHCPAGPAADRVISDPGLRKKLVVASLSGHGESKNLQYMKQGVFAQLPNKARLLQQAIGRMHRQGQQSKVVTNLFSLGTMFEHGMLGALLLDATYQHATTPLEAKIVAATWTTPPLELPESYMAERGFLMRGVPERENEILSRFALDWSGLLDDDDAV